MKSATRQHPVDGIPRNSTYIAELKIRLRSLLSRSNLSLGQLAREMEGAYPTDILSAIKDLQDDENIVPLIEGTASAHDRDESDSNQNGEAEPQLPEPHPLDYDWRFAESSLTFLESLLSRFGSDKIAVLGAPTLYLRLNKIGRSVSLYDNNAQLIEGLRLAGFRGLTHRDLFLRCPSEVAFDTVVADPPWYPEHYAAFIDGAKDLLTPGGNLFLSVLPRLTRPSALDDRMKIISHAYDRGLDILEVYSSVLAYDSPPFELASLRAEGLGLDRWRTGDLFVFRRSSRDAAPRDDRERVDDEQWHSFTIGETIVKVRRRAAESKEFYFQPASPSGDVHLHSVSRRAPFRADIDLWTSRNLALKLSKPDHVNEVLALGERGTSLRDAVVRVVRDRGLSAASKQALDELMSLLMKDAGFVENV
jgi:hypothetical protein